MKKIFIIVLLSLISVTAFSQVPFKIHNPDVRFKWGADSMRFDITGKIFYIKDTIVFSDGTKMWSTDSSGTSYPNYWNRTSDSITTNYNTFINGDFSINNGTLRYLIDDDYMGYGFSLVGFTAGDNVLFGDGIGSYVLAQIDTALGKYEYIIGYSKKNSGIDTMLATSYTTDLITTFLAINGSPIKEYMIQKDGDFVIKNPTASKIFMRADLIKIDFLDYPVNFYKNVYFDSVVTFNDSIITNGINNTGNITATKLTVDTLEFTTDYLIGEMPHCYFYKVDTAGYTLQLDQNVWANIAISAMTDKESHTINRSGDTLIYQGIKPAHVVINININGTTNTANDDLWLRVNNVTAGIITDYDFRTSAGAGNYAIWGINGYSTICNPGEKYLIQMKNKTNGNDLTLYRVSILFNVLHYE